MAYGDFVVDSGRSSRRCRWHSSFPDPEIEVLAKLEMVNPFGSMKDRPARFIVEQGLRTGTLCPGMRLVESTSGYLGVDRDLYAGSSRDDRMGQFVRQQGPNRTPSIAAPRS